MRQVGTPRGRRVATLSPRSRFPRHPRTRQENAHACRRSAACQVIGLDLRDVDLTRAAARRLRCSPKVRRRDLHVVRASVFAAACSASRARRACRSRRRRDSLVAAFFGAFPPAGAEGDAPAVPKRPHGRPQAVQRHPRRHGDGGARGDGREDRGVPRVHRERAMLAPLTKGGNLPFRRLCVERFGCNATVSEMVCAVRAEAQPRGARASAQTRVREDIRCRSRPTRSRRGSTPAASAFESGADFLTLTVGARYTRPGNAALARSCSAGQARAARARHRGRRAPAADGEDTPARARPRRPPPRSPRLARTPAPLS